MAEDNFRFNVIVIVAIVAIVGIGGFISLGTAQEEGGEDPQTNGGNGNGNGDEGCEDPCPVNTKCCNGKTCVEPDACPFAEENGNGNGNGGGE